MRLRVVDTPSGASGGGRAFFRDSYPIYYWGGANLDVTASSWRGPGVHPARGPYGLLGSSPFPAVGSGKLAKIHVHVNGHLVVALLDSGCGACVAGESLVNLLEEAHLREHKVGLRYVAIDMTLTTAKKGERAGVLGLCEATLNLAPGISFRIQMLATRDIPCQLILGIDLLRRLGWRPVLGADGKEMSAFDRLGIVLPEVEGSVGLMTVGVEGGYLALARQLTTQMERVGSPAMGQGEGRTLEDNGHGPSRRNHRTSGETKLAPQVAKGGESHRRS